MVPKWKGREKEYQKLYMCDYRASLKARSVLIEHWRWKFVADVRIPPPPELTGDLVKDLSIITDYYGKLCKLLMALTMFVDVEKKTRELPILDDLDRIFREGYEASQTKLKEA